ncbi:MAG TPA: hypothetical protein VGB94_05555 [Acidobacteriaceae bacterium]
MAGAFCASRAQAQAVALPVPSGSSSSSSQSQSGVSVPGYPVSTVQSHRAVGGLPATSMKPFSKFGVALSMGTLGASADIAVPLSRSFNLRAGTDIFRYSTDLNQDGITYTPNLSLTSAQVSLDWFPFHGSFRISPGYMVYNGTTVSANSVVPGNQSFDMNDTTYYSDPTDPLHGSAYVTWPKAGPRITFGWGNIIPRTPNKHISFPAEFGMAYFGTGSSVLNFAGSVCDKAPGDPTRTCQKANSDPSFQENVDKEHARLQMNLHDYVRFYPILKVGVSYKF